MKKTIFILIAILISVYVLFTALDLKSGYFAERKFWKIERQYVNLVSRQAVITDYEAAQFSKRIGKFVNKEEPRSFFAAHAQLLLGNLYLIKKDFNQARLEFKKVESIFNQDPELLAVANFYTGRSFEVEGNWPQALEIYKRTEKKFALTPTGFSIPLHIAKYYESKKMPEAAARAYNDATIFYENISNKYVSKAIGYDASRLVVLCYLAQQRWAEAVPALEHLLLNYPKAVSVNEAIEGINKVCVGKLKDYDTATRIYNKFIAKYPKHPVVPVMQKMLTGIELLKKSGVVVKPASN